MPTDIPTDDRRYHKLVQKVSLRYLRSLDYYDEERLKWHRMYRWWRQVEDAVAGGDSEYAIRLGYAFALVERINSKITEPMLQMGIPFAVYPRKLGDQAKADNFAQIVRNYYAKPNVQSALRLSKKEMLIVGHRWEVDEWLHIERKGKMWGQVDKKIEVIGPDGKKFSSVTQIPAEVERKIPIHYGFNTRYPSCMSMHPEPYRTTIDTGEKTDMSWFVEDLGYLALEDLAREMDVDPTTKMSVPHYDFSRLLHDAGKKAEARYSKIMAGESGSDDNLGTLIQPIRDWNYQNNWRGRQNGTEDLSESQALEDRDKIWVTQHREMGEILTIAQGKYIIHRKLDPYHVPGLKARIENYTTDPQRLYGKGAIEPIEGELSELDDIHSLAMQNIFRLVNKMLYIREDAIVNEDDFDPRAGGRIRIKSDQADVRAAVADASQNSPVQEMITVESNSRGLMEFESSEMDGAPGVAGTKQQHKTKGGMEVIAANTNTRFITMQAQALINECLRGQSMAEFFAQFAFEPMSYRLYRPDGTTAYATFTKDDVFTEGRGFDFQIEIDPLWGNTMAQRQMSIDIFDRLMEYEKLRPTLHDPEMRKANLDLAMENILSKSGYRDTSKLFMRADNAISPEDELAIVMQDGMVDRCKGDLRHHIQVHLLQAASPALKQAMGANKASADTVKKLQLLVKQAMAELSTFMQDPEGSAVQRLNSAGMSHPNQRGSWS